MKKSIFIAAPIVFAFRQGDNGVKVEEVCRKLGISEATFYILQPTYKINAW